MSSEFLKIKRRREKKIYSSRPLQADSANKVLGDWDPFVVDFSYPWRRDGDEGEIQRKMKMKEDEMNVNELNDE